MNNSVVADFENERLFELVRQLTDTAFWGSVEIKFEAGRVVLLKKTETLKPDHYPRNNRGVSPSGQNR
jgi:hypothetical protein